MQSDHTHNLDVNEFITILEASLTKIYIKQNLTYNHIIVKIICPAV